MVGDLNAYEFSDGYVDVVGQIAGDFNPADNLLADRTWSTRTSRSDPDMPASERYSLDLPRQSQALDHVLTVASVDPMGTGRRVRPWQRDAAVDLINDGERRKTCRCVRRITMALSSS